MGTDEERAGVALTNLDQPLFDESGATKRDLVDYLERMADVMVPHLTDRMLDQLVDDVDWVDHVALVLAVHPAGGEDRKVAIARLIRYDARPSDADVAVTVLDE